MAENQYLSIGEVLGLLLEDFPDVTISKIRFLESQGLIEPERTPSGYRKFYDHDVDLLRAILHEQRANFLPLKVIRDRISSGAIESDGSRTPPRGIRNVETKERDSVFRRTDGGPEWTNGHALIPGGEQSADAAEAAVSKAEAAASKANHPSGSPITTAIPAVAVTPAVTTLPPPPAAVKPAPIAATTTTSTMPAVAPSPAPEATSEPIEVSTIIELSELAAEVRPAPKTDLGRSAGATSASDDPSSEASAAGMSPAAVPPVAPAPVAATTVAPPAVPVVAAAEPAPGAKKSASAGRAARPVPVGVDADDVESSMPLTAEQLCVTAGITAVQLAELQEFGIVAPRGSGADATFHPDAIDVARVAGQFLAHGIDARHLRSWRQSAERESALFEQRIMPLLRQRNPQSRQIALDTLSELAVLGSQLRDSLVSSMLRHHFDGT